MGNRPTVADIIVTERAEILKAWLSHLKTSLGDARLSDEELKRQADELLAAIADSLPTGTDITGKGWQTTLAILEEVSRNRAQQGFSSSETARFIHSLKRPVFERLRAAFGEDAAGLADTTWETSELIDGLAMHTMQTFQKSREAVIARQQEDLLELSTPVVKLWDGILALPMIGTLDSARTQVVMESLLQRIVETGSEVAFIDITGVPTVDTLVAQHLLKTVAAIRLMGAECIISGIRPQIAQTIVHLGVELRGVTTKASLADALAVALDRSGLMVVPRASA
jgi:rsbT co-antagonist protein RsbR